MALCDDGVGVGVLDAVLDYFNCSAGLADAGITTGDQRDDVCNALASVAGNCSALTDLVSRCRDAVADACLQLVGHYLRRGSSDLLSVVNSTHDAIFDTVRNDNDNKNNCSRQMNINNDYTSNNNNNSVVIINNNSCSDVRFDVNCTETPDDVNCLYDPTSFYDQELFYFYLWTVATPTVFAAITAVGTVGNLMVIYVILSRPTMRSVTNLLLVSLAIADVAFLTVCIP